MSIRNMITYTLGTAGYDATGVSCADELFALLSTDMPELIMLDIMLPSEDGISILKRLRADKRTQTIPIIMSTAKGTEYDKVLALDNGADDYLTKPFGMLEMVSRVRAVLRRTERKASILISVGGIDIDDTRHSVSVSGKDISLTLKEYELLKLFANNIGHAYSREQLLLFIWGEEFFGETRTVDVHIGTLRTKLGKLGGYIKTVRGVGYKFEV